MARDRARQKVYWKSIKAARKLRTENIAEHKAQLQETRTMTSPQITVVSQPENSGCLELTPTVSETRAPNIYLTVEREPEAISTAQVQLDLNKMSAEAAVEQSSIFCGNL